jgi:hypothetical protein
MAVTVRIDAAVANGTARIDLPESWTVALSDDHTSLVFDGTLQPAGRGAGHFAFLVVGLRSLNPAMAVSGVDYADFADAGVLVVVAIRVLFWSMGDVANGHPVALVGYSMGAVSAARAVLTDPPVFRCVALRFPVADLLRFPELGIGRHWTTMLGDPTDPAERAALARLSPCHMRSSGIPIPPVLLQIGRFDTRAHPEHGRPEAARAVDEAVRFIITSGGDP